jgi:hypothetical protein
MMPSFPLGASMVAQNTRDKQKVVAIFAGTNSKVTNFLVNSDQELLPGKTYFRQWQPAKYQEMGLESALSSLLSHTATIGSCRRDSVTGATESLPKLVM